LRTKVAREQLAQTRHRVAAEVLALAADAKAAVFTVQAAQQVRERLAVIVETNAAAAELARRQFDAGNISQLDLVQQQAAWQQSKLEFAQTELVLRADRERLTRLLGLFTAPAGGAISGALPTLPSAEPTLGDVENLAVAQRLDLAAAASQVTLAQAALKLKRDTRLLPTTVSLGVDTERNADGTHVTGPGLQLALPIFDQGQADLIRLEAGLRRAEAEVAARTAEIRSEAREARDQLLAARAAVELHEQSLLPQRQLILRETLLHYNAGDKNSYELLAAKEREQQAERAAIAALRDYWLARVALERALGGRLPDLVMAAPARP
jgi:cobalt-zinc-cadmium efflux system outer membrane protein